MIVYNVTINIEESVHEEWVEWMLKKHIPDVMQTNTFTHFRMLKMLNRQPDETGVTYAIQYDCPSMELYEKYQESFAPALQAEVLEKYPGKFVAFRTLLEKVG